MPQNKVTLLYMQNQMANRLFTIANIIANSIENDSFEVSCPCFLNYSENFEVGQNDALMRFPEGKYKAKWGKNKRARAILFLKIANKLKLFKHDKSFLGSFWVNVDFAADKKSTHYTLSDPAFKELRQKHGSLILVGYSARDKDALFRQREKVTHFLRAKEEFTQAAVKHLQPYSGMLVVGVHMRLGDYRNYQDGKFAYSFEQYRSILDQIVALNERPVVFMLACNEEIPIEIFTGLNTFLAPNHPVVDMLCLSQCDLILGPPSTYNSWAAFIHNRPLYHIYDPSKLLSIDDFQPPHWETTP